MLRYRSNLEKIPFILLYSRVRMDIGSLLTTVSTRVPEEPRYRMEQERIKVPLSQKTPEWHDHRLRPWNASEVAVAAGCSQ